MFLDVLGRLACDTANADNHKKHVGVHMKKIVIHTKICESHVANAGNHMKMLSFFVLNEKLSTLIDIYKFYSIFLSVCL